MEVTLNGAPVERLVITPDKKDLVSSCSATQPTLYFDSIGAHDTVIVPFRLRAKYPIRARTFQSRIYEYYQPEVNSIAKPVQLEIYAKERR